MTYGALVKSKRAEVMRKKEGLSQADVDKMIAGGTKKWEYLLITDENRENPYYFIWRGKLVFGFGKNTWAAVYANMEKE